jgi:cobalamin biosynthetic protein CobC
MALPGRVAPLAHGGDLSAARALFPGAPEPFLDLSAGINPNPYPVAQFSASWFTHLPEPGEVPRLAGIAAEAYGAPSAEHVVVSPGSQIAVAQAVALVPSGSAAVLGPTYAEHARIARLAGHEVIEAASLAQMADSSHAIAVNPNNPDGRILAKEALLALADRLRPHGGLLIVDEAFMDASPRDESLAAEVGRGNIIALRSFGKFFGLPGLRLSFALTSPKIAAELAAALGPWPVSGAALAIGANALADKAWIEKTRSALAAASRRLDAMLAQAGLQVVGGTSLFRLVETARADALFRHLGGAGIFVRRFEERPAWLRFGLPGSEQGWRRLAAALRTSLSDQS